MSLKLLAKNDVFLGFKNAKIVEKIKLFSENNSLFCNVLSGC